MTNFLLILILLVIVLGPLGPDRGLRRQRSPSDHRPAAAAPGATCNGVRKGAQVRAARTASPRWRSRPAGIGRMVLRRRRRAVRSLVGSRDRGERDEGRAATEGRLTRRFPQPSTLRERAVQPPDSHRGGEGGDVAEDRRARRVEAALEPPRQRVEAGAGDDRRLQVEAVWSPGRSSTPASDRDACRCSDRRHGNSANSSVNLGWYGSVRRCRPRLRNRGSVHGRPSNTRSTPVQHADINGCPNG